MMLHELGHTTAKLSDEYFAGASYAAEMPNMTAESDPAKVRWSRFIGKNEVGVYEYDNGGNGWYRPHQNCKMRFLGKQYAFCEVCKEQIRKTFCQDSNVTKLFFQPYADMFYESDTGKDMREYFILRRGKNEITGDKLGDALTLTYKDENGNVVSSIPNKAGTYTIEATFAGDSTYEKCSQTASYTIELPDLITLDVPSKVYDGKPADLNYSVNYDKDYTVKAHYKGTVPYAAEITYNYDSDDAPITPGRYKVTLTAYDKATGTAISSKTKDFEITFKSTTLQNNDTADYPGAMPYYNNKTIVFSGEGYTAGEQSQFEDVAKDLLNRGLIEGDAPNYTISLGVAKATRQLQGYTKQKGLDKEKIKQMILQYLKNAGTDGAKRDSIYEYVKDVMPQVKTHEQQLRLLGDILSALSTDKLIYPKGRTWFLKE